MYVHLLTAVFQSQVGNVILDQMLWYSRRPPYVCRNINSVFSVEFCLIHDFPVIIFLQYFDSSLSNLNKILYLDHVFPSVQWLEFLWAFKRYNRFVKLIIIALKLCLSYQRFNFLEKVINCKWFSNTVHSNFVHLCFVFVREPKTLYFVIGQWCDLINTVLLDC